MLYEKISWENCVWNCHRVLWICIHAVYRFRVRRRCKYFHRSKTGEELLRLATCFIIIAIGFSVPSLVYEKENLANSLKVLIHMVTGTVVYLITAFFAGWIKKSFGAIVVYILIALGVAAIFWVIFMLAFKLQADRINRKIREKQDD